MRSRNLSRLSRIVSDGVRERTAMKTTAMIVLAWVLAGCASPALAEKETFTPLHVAKLKMATSVHFSPDGQWIAYTLRVQRKPFAEDSGGAWSELHVVDRQGHARPFVVGKVNVSSVRWTPDGKGISFLAKRGDDEHKSLYVIPVDGGEARCVLSAKSDVSSYSWSPDGKHVAYLAKPEEDKDKKKLEDKGFDAEVIEEDLKPVQVWVAAVDDEEADPRLIELEGSASSLHWSPAGDRLVVALAPSPLIDDAYMRRKVHIVKLDGQVIARLDNPGKLGQLEWSPDGQHLALISAEDLNDPSAGRLMVASADGGALKDILPNFEGQVERLAWQDNDTLMYWADQGVWSTFAKIDADGSGQKTLVPPAEFVFSGLSVSADGQSAAFVTEQTRHPGEVYVMGHGDTSPRRLTDSNPWLADVRFAKQEPISYYARDGLRLEGILYHPLDEKPGQRYPLILAVHGGPEAHERCGWRTDYSRPGQLGAARGFAVFYPNYRGSTGRGVAFSKMGQADYAGKEFDDLIDAVDHLVEMGLVDKDKVGITGGSYGGYASAWCATYHTQRFAASVMFVGISDLTSKFGTTDIPNESFDVHSRTWPWDNWAFYRERSPITYAEKCRTPILIMHGKSDPRVHPTQSMELYRYLKTLGKTPVRLVMYPGEGHGNRKSAGRYDYSLRMLRWMEHYLKGPAGAPPT
ncbi:MAG: prolyl oligopeptidase family serine peptidase, partial [Phycisphaerae bacterium]